ncbi:OmpP1/FadL family transporter [Desulfocurvus sp. DL9XJH121]
MRPGTSCLQPCFAVPALVLALFLILASADTGHAAGYGIYEWSARANAMGGAFAAKADDPSAVAFNPAGITQLPGTQAMVGMTAIAPNTSVRQTGVGGGEGRGVDTVWSIPHGYITRQMTDSVWLGAGLYSRVGLGTDYQDDETFFGRYNCSYAGIKCTSIAGALAYKLTDSLSVAVAPEIILMDFSYNKYTDANFAAPNPATTDTDIKQKLHAQGWAPGYTVALHWQPDPALAVGLVYKGETRLTVNGWADFNRSSAADARLALLKTVPAAAATATLLDAGLRDTGVKGTEPIPALATAGIMIRPLDDLTLEFDLTRTFWSSYRSLTFEYDNVLGSRKSDKKWHDTWRWMVGLEWDAASWLALRAGYVYDDSPIPDDHVDYAVPANDRQIVSLGAGLKGGAWTLDLSYSYLWVTDRQVAARTSEYVYTSTFEDGHSHMLGMALGYSF